MKATMYTCSSTSRIIAWLFTCPLITSVFLLINWLLTCWAQYFSSTWLCESLGSGFSYIPSPFLNGYAFMLSRTLVIEISLSIYHSYSKNKIYPFKWTFLTISKLKNNLINLLYFKKFSWFIYSNNPNFNKAEDTKY